MSKLFADQRVNSLEPILSTPHLDRGGVRSEVAPKERDHPIWQYALFLMIATFVAALIGIYSRPAGFMASWWPANPMLVSLMLRRREFRHPLCLGAAFGALFAADLMTGSDLDVNLAMNATNMTAVFASIVIAKFWLRDRDLTLNTPESVMHLFFFLVFTCAATSTVGMFASHALFGQGYADAWRGWFAGELTNFMAICPVLLTAKPWPWNLTNPLSRRRRTRDWERFWQFALIPLTLGLALVIGGPGAMLFPLPALLWVAVSATVFQTAVLALLSLSALNVFVAMRWLELADADAITSTKVSVQLGLSLLAIGPLVVASTTESRRTMLTELRRRATRDALTGVLTRRAFFDDADLMLEQLASRKRGVGVLMLDIDHFKNINDTYGHPAGDKVLENFAEVVAGCLRRGDLLGRIGGEEFAVVLPAIGFEDAIGVGERIRNAISEACIVYNDIEIAVTVSIGVTTSDTPSDGLATMLSLADQALYLAKATGRDRVSSSEDLDDVAAPMRRADDPRTGQPLGVIDGPNSSAQALDAPLVEAWTPSGKTEA